MDHISIIDLWIVTYTRFKKSGQWKFQGRKQRANRPIYWGGFGPPKTEDILPEPSPAIELKKRKVWSSNDDFSEA